MLGAIDELPRLCDAVFAHETKRGARPYSPSRLYRRFRKVVVASGLDGVAGETIVLHTLRHSFAYVSRRRRKLSEKAIMRMGGWRTRSAFDRYGIADEDEVEEAWDRFEDGLQTEISDLRETHRRGPRRAAAQSTTGDKMPLDTEVKSGAEIKTPGHEASRSDRNSRPS